MWGLGVCLGLGEDVGWATSPGKTSQGEQRKEGIPKLSLRGQKAPRWTGEHRWALVRGGSCREGPGI